MKEAIKKIIHAYTNKDSHRGIHTSEFLLVTLFTIFSFVKWDTMAISADAVVVIAYIFSRTHFKGHFGKPTPVQHITYNK